MIRATLLLIFVCYFAVSSALRCWKCVNQDLNDCQRNGDVEECQSGVQDICHTEVTTYYGRTLIKTGCAKGPECLCHDKENPEWDLFPRTCNRNGQNSVCRCSCTGILCNTENLLCRDRKEDFPPPSGICGMHPEAPAHGTKQCFGDLGLRSFCRFRCNEGYIMEGFDATVCRKFGDEYRWDNPPPICIKELVCVPLPDIPANGDRECDGEGELGTRCDFVCTSGYDLIGDDHTVCDEMLREWSNPTPTCKKVQCLSVPITPRNAEKECTSGRDLGSSCSFACNSGYQLKGFSTTTCVRDPTKKATGRWDQEVPTCDPVCSEPEGPEYGYTICEGIQVGDKCTHYCNPGFDLKGSKTAVCELSSQGAQWSNEVPICEAPPSCEHIGILKHGEIGCNNVNDDFYGIGTVCEFQCTTPGYSLVPKVKSEVVCQSNEEWSKRPCCVDCTNIKRDIIIVLDVSGSINKQDWKDMKAFLQDIVRRFRYGKDASLFTIVQFGTAAQASKNLGHFKPDLPQRVMLDRVDGMERNRGVGRSTMTGKALRYVQSRLLPRKSGNRRDVDDLLFILTDGLVDKLDRKNMFNAASELREAGVEIMALTIGNNPDFVKDMSRVTGDGNKVLTADSVSQLTNDVADTLFAKTCQDGRECEKQ